MNRAVAMFRDGGYQSRRIGRSHTTLTGRLPATKDSLFKTFESPLERDFLVVLDFDWDVESFYDQPVTICYEGADGAQHRYTPDVLVFYRRDREQARDRKPMLAEIKSSTDLEKRGNEYREKFAAAKSYAESRGWEFRVLTEKEIRTAFWRNANFLRPYRQRERCPVYEDWILKALSVEELSTPGRIIATAIDLRNSSPGLIDLLDADERLLGAMMLPSLWQLVDAGRIAVDLNLPLTMDSEIWLRRVEPPLT